MLALVEGLAISYTGKSFRFAICFVTNILYMPFKTNIKLMNDS